jgi:cyd operon protein YbgT
MNIPVRFAIALFLATLVIVIAVILGDYGPWYFSWLLGTGFMVLVAVSGAVLFDAQDAERRRSSKG